jgi:Superinfection immunity protein
LLFLVGAILFSGLIVGAYFAPLIVAIYRGHRNELAIGVLNMLLGWTIIGWVIALVWACTANVGSASKAGWTELDPTDPNPLPLRAAPRGRSDSSS